MTLIDNRKRLKIEDIPNLRDDLEYLVETELPCSDIAEVLIEIADEIGSNGSGDAQR